MSDVQRDDKGRVVAGAANLNPAGANGIRPEVLRDAVKRALAKDNNLENVLGNLIKLAMTYDKIAPVAARVLFEYGWGRAPVEVNATVRRIEFVERDEPVPADYSVDMAEVGGLIEGALPESPSDHHRNGKANRQNGSG